MSRSPGGVGDGLPALPSGEPVLARWFAIAMIPLVLAGVAVTVWAFASFSREPISPAARRPPGTAEVTHDRGQALLASDTTAQRATGCATRITLVGDDGGRSTGRVALSAVCQLLQRGDQPEAEAGLQVWSAQRGILRIAGFELNGLDSSARVEDGRIVIELNPKFQFEDATRAAPAIIHELAHLGGSWPGTAVDAEDELVAVRAQDRACGSLVFRGEVPRGCLDAAAVLAADDVREQLSEAGYGSPSDSR